MVQGMDQLAVDTVAFAGRYVSGASGNYRTFCAPASPYRPQPPELDLAPYTPDVGSANRQ